MKIALDAAKGLAFLHSDEVNMIHGELKTSKILIDSVSGFIDLTSIEIFGEFNKLIWIYTFVHGNDRTTMQNYLFSG